MATSLVSTLCRQKVRRDVAMTGEITLRGRVLAIGGIKEKVLAAHRAGIKTVVLPRDNEKDMELVPDKVRKELEFIFVERVTEVLDVALIGEGCQPKAEVASETPGRAAVAGMSSTRQSPPPA
ncbi:MAG: hypothetical protein C4521_12805 [Actinobacteria bacterium]|nr:MAG: hypothetical protein C4521_12805 [Actinomycetota bacterium]